MEGTSRRRGRPIKPRLAGRHQEVPGRSTFILSAGRHSIVISGDRQSTAVNTNGREPIWNDGWMDGRTDRQTDGWIDGWMDAISINSAGSCLTLINNITNTSYRSSVEHEYCEIMI